MGVGREALTVVVLCKNNQATIRDCLQSVAWAEQRLVYDHGSTDQTLAIARSLHAQVITDPDWQGFGRQRQKAQTHVETDWLLWLDSDEVLSLEAQRSVQRVLRKPDRSKVYQLNRRSEFLGKFLRFGGWYPDRVGRLYCRFNFSYEARMVHEKVPCSTKDLVCLAGDIWHYTAPSLSEFYSKNERYARLWARQRAEERRPVHLFVPWLRGAWTFFSHFLLRLGVLDGWPGLLAAWVKYKICRLKYQELKRFSAR